MDNKNNTKVIRYLDGVMFVGLFSSLLASSEPAAAAEAAVNADASISSIT